MSLIGHFVAGKIPIALFFAFFIVQSDHFQCFPVLVSGTNAGAIAASQAVQYIYLYAEPKVGFL